MTRAFDKYEKRGAYHWKWYKRNVFGYCDFVRRNLSLFDIPGTILDVGCGDGLCSYLLYKRGFSVHGIDLSEASIALAKEVAIERAVRNEFPFWLFPAKVARHLPGYSDRRAQVDQRLNFEVRSIHDMPERKYDYALMQEVIEHISDARGAVEAVARLMRKWAIITTPNGKYVEPHELDYHTWDAKTFMELFSGLKADLIHEDRNNLIVRLHAC